VPIQRKPVILMPRLGVNFWFPPNNLRQLGIATHARLVSVIKVNVTMAKNRNLVFAQKLQFAMAYGHQTWCEDSLYEDAA
jgi:hypothetical protein